MDEVLKCLLMVEEVNKVTLASTQMDRNLILARRNRLRMLTRLNSLRQRQLMLLMLCASDDEDDDDESDEEKEKNVKKQFWEKDCKLLDEKSFRSHFRISRANFQALYNILKSPKKPQTNVSESMPLDKRIAVALYTLGSTEDYDTIAALFSIDVQTVTEVLINFCEEVWNKLWPTKLDNFPLTVLKLQELEEGFKNMGLPQCIGALDTYHIKVNEKKGEYNNCKGWYSTVLLALVDHRSRFIYLNVGTPGLFSDQQVYNHSLLKKHMDSCDHLEKLRKPVCDVDIPLYMIGDRAFRFSKHLMKPYPTLRKPTREQVTFNKTLAECLKVAENAVVAVKARFKRIGRGIPQIKIANKLIKVGCLLHNFLIDNDDYADESWIQEQKLFDQKHIQPKDTSRLDDFILDGEKTRSVLSRYLLSLHPDEGNAGGDTYVWEGDGTIHTEIKTEEIDISGDEFMDADDESMTSTMIDYYQNNDEEQAASAHNPLETDSESGEVPSIKVENSEDIETENNIATDVESNVDSGTDEEDAVMGEIKIECDEASIAYDDDIVPD